MNYTTISEKKKNTISICTKIGSKKMEYYSRIVNLPFDRNMVWYAMHTIVWCIDGGVIKRRK